MGGDREDEEPTDADLDPLEAPDPEMPGDAARNGWSEGSDPAEESSESGGRSEPPSVEEDGADGGPDGARDDGPTSGGDDEPADSSDFDRVDGEPRPGDESAAPDGEDAANGEEPSDAELEALEDIAGVGEAKAGTLRDAGFDTVDDVRAASEEDLTGANGVGETLAASIKADVGGARAEEEVSDGRGDVRPASTDPPTVEDDEPLLSGPQSDQEMPLTAHIEEMMKRLAIVVAIAGVVSLVTFPFAEGIINFLWYNIMPGVPSDIARPRLYGVLELVFTKLKVASLAGLLVALPALVYETFQFMRPGLYPHERRYYLAAIPASLVLALVGVSFAYFIVLPAIFTYFLTYSQDVATIGFALGRTFNLILVLMGYLALVFQIPLFIMLAMMMGLVTRRWLANRRLLFWGAFLGVSFLFSPDPTGMAPVIIALTMVGLFEGTLLLTKWAGRE